LVSDLADDVDGLAGGVDELPVLVAFAGEDGAGVAAAHGDDDVRGGHGVNGELLGFLTGDVDADLDHGRYGDGVDLLDGLGAGGADVDAVAGEVGEPSGGHLGAAGIVDADKEHGRLVRHGVPVSLG